MIRCPNCDTLIDEDRFDLDDDLSVETRARFTGYAAGLAGNDREAPEKHEGTHSNITGRFDVVANLNRHWLIGFDAGASVRTAIEQETPA